MVGSVICMSTAYLLNVAAFAVVAILVAAVSILVPLLLDRPSAGQRQARAGQSRTTPAPGSGRSIAALRGRPQSLVGRSGGQ